MRSILLVEDEKLELEALRDYVDYKKLGIDKVYTARNGRSALECMAEHEPDIVITDIQMPVMNGIKLAERIREEGYQCRIIFLSGYDDFSYVKAGFFRQGGGIYFKAFFRKRGRNTFEPHSGRTGSRKQDKGFPKTCAGTDFEAYLRRERRKSGSGSPAVF